MSATDFYWSEYYLAALRTAREAKFWDHFDRTIQLEKAPLWLDLYLSDGQKCSRTKSVRFERQAGGVYANSYVAAFEAWRNLVGPLHVVAVSDGEKVATLELTMARRPIRAGDTVRCEIGKLIISGL